MRALFHAWWGAAVGAVAACQMVTGTGDLEVVEQHEVVEEPRGADGGAGGTDASGGTAGMPGATGGCGGACMSSATVVSASSSGGGCAHDECKTGVALEPSCSDCATAVCAQDTYCCLEEWDSACMQLVDSLCAYPCGQ